MAQSKKNIFFSKSFFERLNDEPVERFVAEEQVMSDMLRSIKYNLHNILNARIGHAESAPDLGLVDFNDATVTNNDVSMQMKRLIAQCILRYEPRIQSVDVFLSTEIFNPMRLQIRIVAGVYVENQIKKIEFDVLCDGNRHYHIM